MKNSGQEKILLLKNFYQTLDKKYPNGLLQFIKTRYPMMSDEIIRCENKIKAIVQNPHTEANELRLEINKINRVIDKCKELHSHTKNTNN
ncbi:MAG: hypothetical protein ACR2NW_09460 [Thermodesulfobacteriota bacterium]